MTIGIKRSTNLSQQAYDVVMDLATDASIRYISSPQWIFTSQEVQHFAQLVAQHCATLVDADNRQKILTYFDNVQD